MKPYTGNSGNTLETAITILAETTADGIRGEKEYISDIYGIQGVDWALKNQELIFDDLGKVFEKLIIILENGKTKAYYFYIDSFFGKEYR